MRGRILLGGLALVAASTASGEASACVVMPVTYFGHHRPSQWEIAEQERRLARDRVRQRHPVAQAALAGGIDAPAELARMLVPNIRPIPIEHNDCGPENEIDLGDGEERIGDWLAGTYLVRYSNEFAHMVGSYRGETLGPACNAEFRERFAAHLRGRLDARQIRASYLFLAVRWSGSARPASRLVSFEDRRRRPPVRWESDYRPEIERWMRRTGEGRALRQAVDDFWRESTPLLETPDRACPAAVARWPAAQARIVAEIEARNPQLTAAMRRSARRP